MHQIGSSVKFLIKSLCIILFCISVIHGETLIYDAGFRLFDAGEAKISMNTVNFRDKPALHIRSEISTSSFLDYFYRVRDKIDVWADPRDLTLISVKKDIHEGRYTRQYEARISDDMRVFSGNNIYQLDEKVYDPLAAIFMIRQQDLHIGDSFSFSTFEMGSVQKVLVKVESAEQQSVPAGDFECLRVVPVSEDGKPLFKNKGEMMVWFSLDESHLPVRIEQKTNVGDLILRLRSVKD